MVPDSSLINYESSMRDLDNWDKNIHIQDSLRSANVKDMDYKMQGHHYWHKTIQNNSKKSIITVLVSMYMRSIYSYFLNPVIENPLKVCVEFKHWYITWQKGLIPLLYGTPSSYHMMGIEVSSYSPINS